MCIISFECVEMLLQSQVLYSLSVKVLNSDTELVYIKYRNDDH